MAQAAKIQTPHDIVAILWRRKWQIVLPAFVLFVVSIVVTFSWPKTYQSKATILIEEPNISREFLQPGSAVYADKRVQVISHQVLSRQNLVRLIEKFDLSPDAITSDQKALAAARLRERIAIDFISAEVNDPSMAGRRQATIAFTLSFKHQNPETAQRVADELVSLYLSENVRTRRARASGTASFLAREADKLAGVIDDLETKLAVFKSQNAGSLPEQVSITQQALYRIELQLIALRQDIQSQQERKIFLESQLSQISPFASITLDDGTVLRPEERLRKLEAQLSELSYTYGPKHPKMIEISTEIESLRQTMGLGSQSIVEEPSNPAFIQLQAELKAVGGNIRAMQSEQADLTTRYQDLEDQALKAPEIERDYLLITRDYDNAKAEFRAMKEKLAEAQRRESLESESQGEHFSVIEPPEVPLKPIAPKRRILLLVGLMISAVGGLGVAAVAETLDQTVAGPRQLTAITGASPLVIIPYIDTGADRRRAWGVSALLLFGLTAVFAVGLFAVNEYVMPLADLWAKFGPGADST